jgi:hypothetical protein
MAKTKKTSAKAAKKPAPVTKKEGAKKTTAVKSKASAKKEPEKKETAKKPIIAAATKKAAPKSAAPARKGPKVVSDGKSVQTKLKLGFSDGEGAEGEDDMEMPDDFKGFDEGFYESDMDDDDDDF